MRREHEPCTHMTHPCHSALHCLPPVQCVALVVAQKERKLTAHNGPCLGSCYSACSSCSSGFLIFLLP
ncbi:dynactin 6 (predicted), isoform CRA_d [Rattus norvegicus]|uniref:Dynactin 6 (Predicted), isoform CRA_d n=1 Tax=Rattus norvegicus TaxID=10116 RepID=A6IVQ3_RAT|nr:dynactin 6 (predicted), isoform CRA_d [Rattus norvegicus]